MPGRIVFYHGSDLDGLCSGAIAKHALPDIKLFPIEYGDPFPWEIVDSKTEVFLIDFSMKIQNMIRLDGVAGKMTFIDHHKSIRDDLLKNNYRFSGDTIIDLNRSSAALAWHYFFPHDNLPLAVSLIEQKDIGKFHSSELVMPFNYGLEYRNTDPRENMDLWTLLFSNDKASTELMTKIVKSGQPIEKYRRKENRELVERYCFTTEFEGMSCVAMNKGGGVESPLFDSVWKKEQYDLFITFCRLKNKKWAVGLFTEKDIDVSAIAKKYGGGGQEKAAGFTTDTLPFEI